MPEPHYNLSDELKAYCQNQFKGKKSLKTPTAEDHCATFWDNVFNQKWYASDFQMLCSFYPQLHFPVEQDISTTTVYKNAVLKGLESPLKQLKLNQPDAISARIHYCSAGKIPVITVPDEQDFNTLLQSLLYKNNPAYIPGSMGAAFINGINNWGRIHSLKKKWLESNPTNTWKEEFANHILPNTALYKDQIILLSTKFYSNISYMDVMMSQEEWRTRSHSVRLAHECTHLYTARNYGVAANNLHDELIADYMGLVKVFGKYNPELMLRFMGLENYPEYRAGARLENYCRAAAFKAADFKILITIIKNAILNLQCFDEQVGPMTTTDDEASRIEALCETDLLLLASKQGCTVLYQNYNEIFSRKKLTEQV